MITNEMLQVVAEYDGWVKHPAVRAGSLYHQKKQRVKICNNEDLPYATSMDWLHPVSLNTLNNLVSEFNISTKFNTYICASDHIANIKKAMYKPPINGQYIDLFHAVYEAILFINQNKETCNKN